MATDRQRKLFILGPILGFSLLVMVSGLFIDSSRTYAYAIPLTIIAACVFGIMVAVACIWSAIKNDRRS